MSSTSFSRQPSAQSHDVRPILALAWTGGVLLAFLVAFGGWLLPFSLAWAFGSVKSWAIGQYLPVQLTGWGGDLLFGGVLLALALGWGATLVGPLVPRKSPLGLLFAAGVGLGVIGVAVMVVGAKSVGALSLLWLGLAIWVLPAPRWFVRMTAFSTERADWWTRFLMLAVLVLAVVGLLLSLVPSTDPAVLGYHLRVPAGYKALDQVGASPVDTDGPMSEFVEWIYLVCLTQRSEVTACIMHWMFGVLTAAAVGAVGTLVWSRRVGWMAAAFFYAQPFVHRLGSAARVELAFAFYAVLAYGCMVVWWQQVEEPDNRYLWMSALSGGLAMATAWVGLSVVVAPLFLIVVIATFQPTDRSRGRLMLQWPVFLLLAVVPVLPGLIKFAWWTGQLGDKFLVEDMGVMRVNLGRIAPGLASHLPLFAWRGLFDAVGGIFHYSLLDAGALPVLLMAAPLAFLHRKLEPSIRAAAWLWLAVYVGWLVGTDRSGWLLLPSGAMAAWVGAYGLERFCRRGASRYLLQGIFAGGICLGVIMTVLLVMDTGGNGLRASPLPSPVPYLLGQETRDDLLFSMDGTRLKAVSWMNQSLPSNARVLFVSEQSPVYVRVSVVWGAPLERHPVLELVRGASSISLMARLQKQKITHVYVERGAMDRLVELGRADGVDVGVLEMFLQRHAAVRHNTGDVVIYELNP